MYFPIILLDLHLYVDIPSPTFSATDLVWNLYESLKEMRPLTQELLARLQLEIQWCQAQWQQENHIASLMPDPDYLAVPVLQPAESLLLNTLFEDLNRFTHRGVNGSWEWVTWLEKKIFTIPPSLVYHHSSTNPLYYRMKLALPHRRVVESLVAYLLSPEVRQIVSTSLSPLERQKLGSLFAPSHICHLLTIQQQKQLNQEYPEVQSVQVRPEVLSLLVKEVKERQTLPMSASIACVSQGRSASICAGRRRTAGERQEEEKKEVKTADSQENQEREIEEKAEKDEFKIMAEKVSLLDCHTLDKIVVPVRGLYCKHFQCFDLAAFAASMWTDWYLTGKAKKKEEQTEYNPDKLMESWGQKKAMFPPLSLREFWQFCFVSSSSSSSSSLQQATTLPFASQFPFFLPHRCPICHSQINAWSDLVVDALFASILSSLSSSSSSSSSFSSSSSIAADDDSNSDKLQQQLQEQKQLGVTDAVAAQQFPHAEVSHLQAGGKEDGDDGLMFQPDKSGNDSEKKKSNYRINDSNAHSATPSVTLAGLLTQVNMVQIRKLLAQQNNDDDAISTVQQQPSSSSSFSSSSSSSSSSSTFSPAVFAAPTSDEKMEEKKKEEKKKAQAEAVLVHVDGSWSILTDPVAPVRISQRIRSSSFSSSSSSSPAFPPSSSLSPSTSSSSSSPWRSSLSLSSSSFFSSTVVEAGEDDELLEISPMQYWQESKIGRSPIIPSLPPSNTVFAVTSGQRASACSSDLAIFRRNDSRFEEVSKGMFVSRKGGDPLDCFIRPRNTVSTYKVVQKQAADRAKEREGSGGDGRRGKDDGEERDMKRKRDSDKTTRRGKKIKLQAISGECARDLLCPRNAQEEEQEVSSSADL